MTQSPDSARMLSRLERLVGIDTQNPPGREVEAALWLAAELKAMGFAVDTTEILPGRCNVAARLDNGPGPTFAFNSHIDVVPVGGGWASDPLRLAERGGRLYGRGSCDAKGPIVGMLEALQMLAADRASWRGTLMALFVADEEAESRGAKAYVAGKPARIDYVIVGEPTSNATVAAHKGSLRPIVRVKGKTAHSGTPELGVNAVFQAARLLARIEAHHKVVCTRCHPLVGSASLTVTRISGGHADNVVPDACELLVDRRLVPGEDEAAAIKEIQGLLDAARSELGIEAEIVALKPTTGGATETALDNPIVKAAIAAGLRQGADGAPRGFQGACDLVHFRSIGAQGVVVGPGSLDVAHKPDEFVPKDEFIRSSLVFRDAARQMLQTSRANF
ncbi:MAG: M20 family metallopeptidase [Alphaproteobacteria bacterium]|nr:M20 family metallopeptidase [Alphaproteobacteria bacterium]